MSKRRKVRVDFRKNREKAPREGDITRRLLDNQDLADQLDATERVRAKGDLSRRRTVHVDAETNDLALPSSDCRRGRVLIAHGLNCLVVTDDGKTHRCFIRRLLKSMATDERGVVTTGDWAWFRPSGEEEGLIVRVEPRSRLLTRLYRNREHVIAANVDQVLIVASLTQPELKPNLIDRYLVSAGRGELEPVICLNKADLVDAPRILPLMGLYSQLGIPVLLTSVRSGLGLEALREILTGRETVIVGQSGVGKSSLLNALDPRFHLKVSEVGVSNKGKHTTTSAQLLQWREGGSVVDTPGIRQFDLWDLPASELHGWFLEMRPFVARCRFPGCSHLHEDQCAVRQAVSRGMISDARYESYRRMLQGEAA